MAMMYKSFDDLSLGDIRLIETCVCGKSRYSDVMALRYLAYKMGYHDIWALRRDYGRYRGFASFPAQLRQALELRSRGMSWAEIATQTGYASSKSLLRRLQTTAHNRGIVLPMHELVQQYQQWANTHGREVLHGGQE